MGMLSTGGNEPGSLGPAELKGVGNPSSGLARQQEPGCAGGQLTALTLRGAHQARLPRAAKPLRTSASLCGTTGTLLSGADEEGNTKYLPSLQFLVEAQMNTSADK